MDVMTLEAPATPRATPVPWTAIVFFSALLLLAFYDVLAGMLDEWLNDGDMGHGLAVPPFAAYVAWRARDRLLALPRSHSAWGFALIAWGGLQLAAGTLGAEMFVARTALVITLAGIVLALGGFPLFRALAFPLFALLFMVRIPNILYLQVTFPLQLFASAVASSVLTWIDIPVFREGNILHLANRDLSVVDACSGIRSLLTLTFLSLVYAYLFDEKPWMRAVLFVLTIPIAVAANAFRVTMTGIVSAYKPELAEGTLHELEGGMIFFLAVLCMFAAHHAIEFAWNRLKRTA